MNPSMHRWLAAGGAVCMLVATVAVSSTPVASGSAAQAPTTTLPPPVTTTPQSATTSTVPAPQAPPAQPTAPAAPTTPLPDVGLSTLPPTTAPPAPAVLQFRASSPPLGIPMEVGGGPQYLPSVVLPPGDEQPWVMFGDYRSNPGAVSQVVAYSAPAASPDAWVQAGFTGEEQPTFVGDAVRLVAGSVLVVGSIDNDAGPLAAAWVYADGAFADPESVGESESLSRITRAAVSADGTVYAVVERYVARRAVRFELAKRSPDGTWTVSEIRPDARNIAIYGIAVQGSTVVLTGDSGSDLLSDTKFDAAVFTSLDDGATFQVADTRAFVSADLSTAVTDVVVGGPGFVAAACLEGPGAARAAIVQSADGMTWSELTFSGPPGFPMVAAGCNAISIDADGGIWLGGAGHFDATFYRVADGAIDHVAVLFVTGEQGTVLNPSAIRFAADAATLAVSVPQSGGPAAGFVPIAAAADPANPYEIEPVGDAPASHEIIRDLEVINDLGNVIGVRTFPFIDEATATYLNRTFPFTLSAVGLPSPAPDAAPLDPVTGAYLTGIVSLPSGDVSLSTAAEAPDTPTVGTVGDIVVARRPPGGEWSAPEIVLGGVGAQDINGVTVVGGVVVGVGRDVVTNATTGVDEGKAIVLFGDGTSLSRIDLDVDGSNRAEALDVCALPDNRALVVGYDGQARLGFTALVDIATGTAAVYRPQIEPWTAVPVTCHAAAEGAIVEAVTGTGTLLYQTRDGITFHPIDVLADDDSVNRVRSSAHGVAIVGVTGPAGEDAFVLFGPSIESLQRVEIDAFAGAGVQVANDIVIDDGVLFVIGTINMSPVVWPIVYE